jgi:hypothetical protein
MAFLLKPSEEEGTYRFDGAIHVTTNLTRTVSLEEITALVMKIRQQVSLHDGIDYLQVFTDEDTDRTVWAIDHLNDEMKASGDFDPDYNHWTLLLPSDY